MANKVREVVENRNALSPKPAETRLVAVARARSGKLFATAFVLLVLPALPPAPVAMLQMMSAARMRASAVMAASYKTC